MVKGDAVDWPKGSRRYRTSRGYYPDGKASAELRAFGPPAGAESVHRWSIMRIGEPV